jgi:hypothetical protein
MPEIAGDGGIVSAGRQIRSELPDLLADDSAATQMASALDQLISAAESAPDDHSREAAVEGLHKLLTGTAATSRRLRELHGATSDTSYLEFERGFGFDSSGVSYDSLAGDDSAAHDSWVCPKNDYAWVVFDADDPQKPPSTCPEHHIALVFRPAGS